MRLRQIAEDHRAQIGMRVCFCYHEGLPRIANHIARKSGRQWSRSSKRRHGSVEWEELPYRMA